MQKKLSRGKLLNEKGELIQSGFSTSLVKDYSRRDIKACKLRIKEWDYYLVYNDNYAVALTIADNSYMGIVSASVIDFGSGMQETQNIISILPLGRTKMPSSSVYGDISVQNQALSIKFINDGKKRKLELAWNSFVKGKNLVVDITLKDEPKDSMVIATPFAKDKKAFYYNQKIVGMRAEGRVVFGEKEILFGENSFGILDWGRGVWTYKNTWFWGSAAGVVGGKIFGFNIGYGFGDNSSATENMLFWGGYAHKIEDVTFVIPKDEKGKDDFLKPWKFISGDGRFEMDFNPILNRSSNTNLGILMSDQNQVFGRFSGKVVLDDKKVLEVKDLLGFAEKVRNRW